MIATAPPPATPSRVREHVVHDDYRYRIEACLRHRYTRTPDGVRCANEWCRQVFVDAPRAIEPTTRRAYEHNLRWDGHAWQCTDHGCNAVFSPPATNTPMQVEAVLSSLQEGLLDTVRRQSELRELKRRVTGGLASPAEYEARSRQLTPDKGVWSYAYDEPTGRLTADLGVNRVVISGRRISGRRAFSISGDTPPSAINAMGIDNNTNNPVDGTDQFDTTSANRSIKAFDGGFATITGVGVSPVKVTAQATWTQADNPGPKTFVVRRIGLANATDNTAGTLYSLLGGTTPSSILNLDFTGLATFTLKFQVEVTLSNQSAQ